MNKIYNTYIGINHLTFSKLELELEFEFHNYRLQIRIRPRRILMLILSLALVSKMRTVFEMGVLPFLVFVGADDDGSPEVLVGLRRC